MKTKFAVALLFMLSVCYTASTQEASIEWSEKFENNGTDLGFFDQFVGESGNLIFASFAHQPGYLGYTTQRKPKNFQYRLVCYDKNSLKQLSQVEVRPFKDEIHNGLMLMQTIVMQNRIFVFWQKNLKNGNEIFAESFDLQLKPMQALTSILKQELPEGVQSALAPVLLYNKNVSSKIIVGFQNQIDLDMKYHLYFKTINEDFLISDYTDLNLGISSFLEINTFMSNPNAPMNANMLFIMKPEYFLIDDNTLMLSNFSTVNMTTQEVESYSVAQEGFTYSGIRIEQSNNGVRIAGFYKDLSLVQDDAPIHGFFIAKIDTEQKKLIFKHHPFSKAFLDDFYISVSNVTTIDQLNENEAAKASTALSGLTIEQVEEGPEGYVIFCTIVENGINSRSVNTSTMLISDVSTKVNLYTLAVDNSLNYKWHSTIKRKKTFGAQNIQDIQLMPIDNGYFVTYGDETFESKDGKSKSKSKKQLRDEIQYALILSDGNTVKKTLTINDQNTLKSNRKYVSSVSGYTIYGNTLYVQSWHLQTKGSFYPLAILTFGAMKNKQSKFREGHIEIGRLIVR